MALKPRYVVMVFFSGSKGGTGKSTLAANLAILLSQSLKTNTLLIDLGVDSSQTASRILGVVPDKQGALDYLVGSVGEVNRLVDKSSYLSSVFVVPPGMTRSYQLNIGVKDAYSRWLGMLGSLVMATGASVILIDMPANAPMPITVPPLLTAQIINIVLDHAAYSEYVLREIDNAYIQPMLTQLGYKQVINVILNKSLPNMDVDNRIRGYARNGEVFVLPTSPIVQYLTATLKPVVLYEPRGTLAEFRKAFDNMTNTLTRQVKAMLTGHVD
ncbi:hypothetical protein JCM14467A_00370 [Vulcanisaeta sp. JCM 14467]